MARVTFREAARRKILWIAAAGRHRCSWVSSGPLFISFSRHTSPQDSTVSFREGIVMMTMMVLYAGSMMTSLMAVLTSCDTLSGEIVSGTIHAIATKPVERWCLVLGKWLGFVGMLTLYVLLIEGGSIGLSWFESGYLAHHALAVLSLIWLQSVVLLGVTMAASTCLLLAYQRRCLAGPLRSGLRGWMDRAVRLFAARAGFGQPGDSLQPHHAQRRALAPRGLQISAASAGKRRCYSLHQQPRAQQCHGGVRRSLRGAGHLAGPGSFLPPGSVGATPALNFLSKKKLYI